MPAQLNPYAPAGTGIELFGADDPNNVTRKSIERRRRLAERLADYGKYGAAGWAGVASDAFRGLLAGYQEGRANSEEKGLNARLAKALSQGTDSYIHAAQDTGDLDTPHYLNYLSDKQTNQFRENNLAEDTRHNKEMERIAGLRPVTRPDWRPTPDGQGMYDANQITQPGQPPTVVPVQGMRKPPSAQALKNASDAQLDVNNADLAVQNLQSAKDYMGKGYSGWFADTRAALGSAPSWAQDFIPDWISEPKAALATQQAQAIMEPEAFTILSNVLKGSTAYGELMAFKKVYADPNVPLDRKNAMADRLIAQAKAIRDAKAGLANQFKTEAGGPQMGGAPPPPPQTNPDMPAFNSGDGSAEIAADRAQALATLAKISDPAKKNALLQHFQSKWGEPLLNGQ